MSSSELSDVCGFAYGCRLAISRPGKDPADALLGGRPVAMMYVVSRRHSMFETYWTNPRSVEVMDNSHGGLEMTRYGRQESWEDSPAGWPQRWEVNGDQAHRNVRPTAQL